jgi:hypothetical protein
MTLFDGLERSTNPQERYAGTPGAELWQQYANGSVEGSQELHRQLVQARVVHPPAPVSCVFVSHRKTDEHCALKVARCVGEHGYDYWIDSADPMLALLTPGAGPSDPRTALLIACVIEMALLNCSRLVAVISANTAGSAWVPYELGRVKEPALLSRQACCFVDPGNPPKTVAEYLLLVAHHDRRAALEGWLGPKGSARAVPGHWPTLS